MIRIAVDAMGGDYAPREVVHGAVLAAREYGVAIHLVGPVDQVNTELKRHDVKGLTIEIVPCSEVVEMGEKATKAILKKKDSSIVVTTKLVADGVADGMVAAGSTGAAGVAAQLGLGRIKNVERAAIAAMLPTTTKGKQVIIVDVGANVECNPNQLLQFGLMGSILAKGMQGCVNPTIGLLNIGTEETKGNKLVQDTFQLLKAHKEINFIGFVEGRDFPMNKVDVVVTDGFTHEFATHSTWWHFSQAKFRWVTAQNRLQRTWWCPARRCEGRMCNCSRQLETHRNKKRYPSGQNDGSG
jgi:glycerol-3-phosphate acyltransferase PlsX